MKDKELLNLWQRGNDLMKNGQINHDQIKKLLKPRINRLSAFVRSQLFTYLLAQFVSIILLSINLYGYRGNIIIQVISSALIILCFFFLFVGKNLFKSFKRINQQHNDIFHLLKEKIVFFRHKFERWNFIASFTLWILVFAVNTNVDNLDGGYRINKPFLYIGISIALMVFIYITNKSAAETIFKETRACLSELENAWDGVEESLARIRKRQLRIKLLLVVILIIFFIIGLLLFLSRS